MTKFDKIILDEGSFKIRQRTTWNASATKSRTTFALTEDGGQTWSQITRTEATFTMFGTTCDY